VGLPSIASTSSPGRMPARSAGEPWIGESTTRRERRRVLFVREEGEGGDSFVGAGEGAAGAAAATSLSSGARGCAAISRPTPPAISPSEDCLAVCGGGKREGKKEGEACVREKAFSLSSARARQSRAREAEGERARFVDDDARARERARKRQERGRRLSLCSLALACRSLEKKATHHRSCCTREIEREARSSERREARGREQKQKRAKERMPQKIKEGKKASDKSLPSFSELSRGSAAEREREGERKKGKRSGRRA